MLITPYGCPGSVLGRQCGYDLETKDTTRTSIEGDKHKPDSIGIT